MTVKTNRGINRIGKVARGALLGKKSAGMGNEKKKPAKKPTKPMRIHLDVAVMVESLAPLYGQSAPDFVSDRLRAVLQGLVAEAPEKLQKKLQSLLSDP